MYCIAPKYIVIHSHHTTYIDHVILAYHIDILSGCKIQNKRYGIKHDCDIGAIVYILYYYIVK